MTNISTIHMCTWAAQNSDDGLHITICGSMHQLCLHYEPEQKSLEQSEWECLSGSVGSVGEPPASWNTAFICENLSIDSVIAISVWGGDLQNEHRKQEVLILLNTTHSVMTNS